MDTCTAVSTTIIIACELVNVAVCLRRWGLQLWPPRSQGAREPRPSNAKPQRLTELSFTTSDSHVCVPSPHRPRHRIDFFPSHLQNVTPVSPPHTPPPHREQFLSSGFLSLDPFHSPILVAVKARVLFISPSSASTGLKIPCPFGDARVPLLRLSERRLERAFTSSASINFIFFVIQHDRCDPRPRWNVPWLSRVTAQSETGQQHASTQKLF